MAALKRDAAAEVVRGMIADGTLSPGAPAPSGAALARETGLGILTCRRALRALLADGTLIRGVSPTARLRVAQAGGRGSGNAEALRAALSRALRARRRAVRMTQPELAVKLGVSLTTVGHAETGRAWQGRGFWDRADQELGAAGDLLRMFDRYKLAECAPSGEAAGLAPEEAVPGAPVMPVLPLSVTITLEGVNVVWPDGSETLARPPKLRDGADTPGPVPEPATPAERG